ncbi:LuxR C-terminal-related transcriptional regulator [Phytopseudomonas dryadis]|nr:MULTISPECIES: response regulator transcription factor [Pseudomonas]
MSSTVAPNTPALPRRERVIVADDHPLFRDGMLRIVQRIMPDAEIVEAASLDEVLLLARAPQAPDMLVLDLLFPGCEGAASVAGLRQEFHRTSLVVVSMVDDQQVIGEVMAAGADGFISKAATPDAIGQALLQVRNGEFVTLYGSSGVRSGYESQEQLTPRQQDVLRLLVEGLSNKEIARQLDISPFTVRIHVSALLRTLNVSSRAAAAAKGAQKLFRLSLGTHSGES